MTSTCRPALTLVVAVIAGGAACSACSASPGPASAPVASAPAAGERAAGTDPAGRAVTIRTTACGDASRTTGTGVIVGPTRIVTAGHVVVGATDLYVGDAGDPAVVVLLDRTRDLAVLKAPGVDASPVDVVGVAAGDAVRVVGGASSGTVEGRVARLLRMDVDDVRSTTRSTRSGFELDVELDAGDSGAGVFDAAGRLAGIVFATPTGRSGATFAVDATEIAAVLDAPVAGEHRCDPARSQLAAPPPG